MKKFFKTLSIILSMVVCCIFMFSIVEAANLPDNYKITSDCSPKLKKYLRLGETPITAIKSLEHGTQNNDCKFYSTNVLFMNVIPIKKVNIQKIEDIHVVPCGNPFGVKLFTKGVIIVGISDIKTTAGLVNPAKQAGLQKGDIILTINKNEINSNEDLINSVEKSNGNNLSVEVIRNGIKYETTITPIKNETDGVYKLGIWVRDSSAGIGTITFWDKNTKIFGGLGHGICDVDTGELLPLSHGDIIKTNINGILKGTRGNPGELKGYFIECEPIGFLTENTYSGVYGKLNEFISEKETIPVAMKQQVKTGKAQILTTIFGNSPEYYDIDIMHINYNEESPSKNMIIKITDHELLDKTGGIIQGMSGSPIIQNGMLVGAITHVFVNNPQKGYAIFAENMISKLQEQGDSDYKKAS